jgi:hypothetical protein
LEISLRNNTEANTRRENKTVDRQSIKGRASQTHGTINAKMLIREGPDKSKHLKNGQSGLLQIRDGEHL